MHCTGLLQCISCATAVVLTLRFVFGYARKKRSAAAWAAMFASAAAEAAVMLLRRSDPETADLLQEALILICTVLFPYLLLRRRRKRTFLLFALAYCATADYIAAIVPAAYTDAVYILLDVLVCASAIAAYKTNRHAPPDYLDQVPAWIYIAVFAADLSAYYSGMLRQDTSYYPGVSTALQILSVVLIGGSAFLIVQRVFAAQRAERAASERLAAQLRHYEQLVEKNRSVRAFRHDYENNLLSLGAILDAGQTADARDYVHRLQGDVQSAAYDYTTGNYLADAILSDKAKAAKEIGVRIAFTGTVPVKGIENPDLCTILCNLIDNAIRGSESCAPCVVETAGRETADRWLLTVKNPVTQKVAIRGGTVRTSKADKENHGLGIANVRRAAEKYQGYLDLECDDCCFTAEVGLMLNTEEIA